MLYYLFDFLDSLDFPGAGMFKYVSFRAAIALILSLMISTIIGRRIIDKLQKLQIGEIVRNLGLEGQLSKKGTPTMGGIIIIIAILVPVLLLAKLDNIYIILMLITTIGRLHQSIQKGQRRAAWQIQNSCTGRIGTNCRIDIIFQSGCYNQGKYRVSKPRQCYRKSKLCHRRSKVDTNDYPFYEE